MYCEATMALSVQRPLLSLSSVVLGRRAIFAAYVLLLRKAGEVLSEVHAKSSRSARNNKIERVWLVMPHEDYDMVKHRGMREPAFQSA